MFIAIEGLDNAGKTTLALRLTNFLCKKGLQTLLTCEPYECEATDRIQAILKGSIPMPSAQAFAALFTKMRHLHTEEVIIPSLHDHFTVVTDRYIGSTFAYNTSPAYTREDIEEAHRKFYVPPTFFVYLRITPEQSYKRNAKTSVFDKDILKQADVFAKYEDLFLTNTVNICGLSSDVLVVDATLPKEKIVHRVAEKLLSYREGMEYGTSNMA